MVSFALVTAVAGRAQQAVAQAGQSVVITGSVIDSVRGRYLSEATVSIVGRDFSVVADTNGVFRIAIPAGTHSLAIRHPFLDSLGITLTTSPREFHGGDTTMVVSIPSPRTLVNAKCTPEDRSRGPAALTGIVSDAVTGSPAADATVSVTWIDYEVAGRSIRRTPQRRIASVNANGTFKLCGLPDGLVEGIVASRENQSTAPVDVDLSSLLEVMSFRIPPAKSSRVSGHTASISGRVIDGNGRGAPDVRVAIDDDSAFATTNGNGYFALKDVRVGTRPMSIRKLGHEAVEIPIDVPAGGASGLSLTLGRSVEMLKAMLVTASLDPGLKRVGFDARRRVVAGSFLGPSDIDRIFPSRLAQVLERIPRYRRSDGCTRYYVDGRIMPEGENPENFVQGIEIGAVEVYTQSFVPGEFPAYTRSGRPCKAVVIWTKWKIGLR